MRDTEVQRLNRIQLYRKKLRAESTRGATDGLDQMICYYYGVQMRTVNGSTCTVVRSTYACVSK